MQATVTSGTVLGSLAALMSCRLSLPARESRAELKRGVSPWKRAIIQDINNSRRIILSTSEQASRRRHHVPHFGPRCMPRLSPGVWHFVGVNKTYRRQITAHCRRLNWRMWAKRVVDTVSSRGLFLFLYLRSNQIAGLLPTVFTKIKKVITSH